MYSEEVQIKYKEVPIKIFDRRTENEIKTHVIDLETLQLWLLQSFQLMLPFTKSIKVFNKTC